MREYEDPSFIIANREEVPCYIKASLVDPEIGAAIMAMEDEAFPGIYSKEPVHGVVSFLMFSEWLELINNCAPTIEQLEALTLEELQTICDADNVACITMDRDLDDVRNDLIRTRKEGLLRKIL